MIAENYPPLNVLSIFKGFERPGVQHRITPYRIQKKNGDIHIVKEVRQVTRHRSGGKLQYRFMVRSKEDFYVEILFDTHTYTWRLMKEVHQGIVVSEYGKK